MSNTVHERVYFTKYIKTLAKTSLGSKSVWARVC